MSEERPTAAPVPDPDESPFKVQPIAGIPFKRGSGEDEAINRILKWREAAETSDKSGEK